MTDTTSEQPQSPEPVLSKRERKRLRQEERRRENASAARYRRLRRFSKIASMIGVIAILVFMINFVFKLASPKGADMSVSYPVQSSDHIEKFTPHPPYNSNPPTGGWHYGETAEDGAHKGEVADEYLVHNLEHGDIWISYHPRVSEEVKNELIEFGDEPRIVVTPRSANEHDVALSSWGHLDAFNLDGLPLDATRVSDFIKRYRNKGPEKVPAGAHGKTDE
ncbi:MAG: DUF3105 domain-containing protein [Candidatus Jacksonbacteria bacterium]|nr:DUF3105 domain-containing protein [Candidatus Jacksonbacteria bacterium]